VVSSAFGSSQGFQFGGGLQFEYSRFSASTVISLSHTEQNLQFNIPAWEVPVIDVDGTIKGYLILSDTSKETVSLKSKFSQNEIALPINLSYKQNFLKTFSMELGIGLLPKLQTTTKLKFPGIADMLNSGNSKIKSNFSVPMSIRFGLYKDFPQFTAGFTSLVTPFYNSKYSLPGEVNLKGKQTTIQFTLYRKL